LLVYGCAADACGMLTLDPRRGDRCPRFGIMMVHPRSRRVDSPTAPLLHCAVCGWDPGYPSWGEDGRDPTFDICSCCGVEWGYEDSSFASTASFRDAWIARGAPWNNRREPHDGLRLEDRLKRAWVVA
jgi:hypothetical protein